MSTFPAIAQLLQWLEAEEASERAQHEETLQKVPLSERRKTGISWYPIQIRESYYDRAERLTLEIERPQNRDISHQFQNGQAAMLFSTRENDPTHRLRGIVSAVRDNQLRITLQADELPEWAENGKLGIDALFDEVSFKEMRQTLKAVTEAKSNRLAHLRDVLLGDKMPDFEKDTNFVVPANLNAAQAQAVQKILQAKDLAIVHGPPGTGKTTTITEAIALCLATKPDAQILVCAPSNNAVDLLTAKLHEKGLRVLRLGNPARISEQTIQHTLDQQITQHPEYKRINEYKKQAAAFRNMASRYKRNFGRDERNQRKLLFDEAYKLLNEVQKTEEYIVGNLTSKAQIITCTPVGSTHKSLSDKVFDWVFVDEAAQALEPLCWIPIQKAQRIVLAGDHKQLPPTVKTDQPEARQGLSITLFEKAIALQPQASVMLNTQYRMHQMIMGFSGEYFYQNKLACAPSVLQRKALASQPFELIDTAGCGFEEKNTAEGSGIFNPEEAQLLHKIWRNLQNEIPNIGQCSVGVISPYRAQVEHLRQVFAEDLLSNKKLTVNTIDGFQGQERDIILISLVRSNDRQEIGFLADYRRMNVALTRARHKLIVLGDSATFADDVFYGGLLAYAEAQTAYRSAWEFLGD